VRARGHAGDGRVGSAAGVCGISVGAAVVVGRNVMEMLSKNKAL
jgi:hypothetical protein